MTSLTRRRIGGAVIAASLSGALVFGAPMAFADPPPEPGQNQMQGPGDNQGPPEPGQNQMQGPGANQGPPEPGQNQMQGPGQQGPKAKPKPAPRGKKGKRKPPPPPWWSS